MGSLALDVTLRIGRADLRVQLATSARAVGIVGPSGAGKSTLLRVLAGLDRRAVGTVRFGEVWQDASTFRPPWERGVGWVPQDGVLFPHLSVAENLGYAARIPVEPVARILGVEHLLGRQPRNLSGGERQRVALGRALCAAPRLLLLDEPFAALDKPLRTQLGGTLSSYLVERSIPLVLVTHDEADLAALVEEAWEIREGRLIRL